MSEASLSSLSFVTWILTNFFLFSCSFLSLHPVTLCLSLFCSPLVKVALVPIATHSELLLISVAARWMAWILHTSPQSCDFIPTQLSLHMGFFLFFFFYITAREEIWTFAWSQISLIVVVEVWESTREDWEATLGNVPRHAWLTPGFFFFWPLNLQCADNRSAVERETRRRRSAKQRERGEKREEVERGTGRTRIWLERVRKCVCMRKKRERDWSS